MAATPRSNCGSQRPALQTDVSGGLPVGPRRWHQLLPWPRCSCLLIPAAWVPACSFPSSLTPTGALRPPRHLAQASATLWVKDASLDPRHHGCPPGWCL